MLSLTTHTLLLNAGYEPLRVVVWQRAFTLAFQGKADILEEYGILVSSVTKQFRIPAVIRLRRWVNLRRVPPVIRFSRANVYIRDGGRCQYCWKHFPEKDLTLDHVLPQVRGGKKTWENIVSACIHCNQRKGNRTPEEAEMKLLKKPHAPSWLPGMMGTIKTSPTHHLWGPYLSLALKLNIA